MSAEGQGAMPELFRHYGFVLEYARQIKSNDLKRIEQMISENADIILKRWKEVFGETDGQD